MPKPYSFGEIHLDVTAGRDRAPHVAEPDTPFRIALLGDFSGRGNRGLREAGVRLASWRPALVDRDNFEEVLAKSGAAINLSLSDRPSDQVALRFADLDDFHPDRIFERVELFRRLRETRSKLADPSTFAAAAAELGLEVKPASGLPKPVAEQRPVAPEPSRLVSGNILDQLVDEAEGRATAATPSRAPDELSEFVRRVTAPHLVPAAHPRQAETIAVIDRATNALMRALLHVPDFQSLEAAWRMVFFLVRRLETDSGLKLYLIDVSKAELAADLLSSDDLRSTGTYKLLVEPTVETPGAEPWALLAGNYAFDPTREDAELLGRLAKIASAAGAPFISAASLQVLGCRSAPDLAEPRTWSPPDDSEGARAWQALREIPQASWLGLALPRFLLRLPYGKKTDAVETFDFEEMPEIPTHEHYLWGNPAFACVLLLAQAFSEHGWDFRPGVVSEIAGLPLHVYEQDGESQLKPCAEVLLTEHAAELILEKGLMPLASLKGSDVVRVVRFQSIADPLAPLKGRWA
jgi:type VI secretion system protein ImpC